MRQACLQLRTLPGRLRAWLHALVDQARRSGAAGRVPQPARARLPTRDLSAEFERFMHIGERLERGLEALKDIQWEIRENEARYRDLLDNQADVILRRDARGRLTFVNQAFCRVFGLERERGAGPPVSRRACWPANEAVPLAPGADAAPAALRAGDRDRSAARAGSSGRSTPCRRSEAAVPEVQCLGRDITERRRAEAELQGGAQAGGSRQPRQVALPGGHEPRDPHADERHPRHDRAAARHRARRPSNRPTPQAIERSARTLLTLIDEILDFSKIEADKLQLNSAAAGDRRLRAGRRRVAGAQGLREGHRHRLGGRPATAAAAAGRRGARCARS